MDKNVWKEFEDCLRGHQNLCFWWRDDDVKPSKPKLFSTANLKYEIRLKRILALLKKYQIPSVYAVIPQNFIKLGTKQIKMLKEYGAYVVVHGIKHISHSKSEQKNEFPDDCDVQKDAAQIMAHKKEFENVFGKMLLNSFVPPFNTMTKELEDKLLSDGFNFVSKANFGNENPKDYNIDIDFIIWQTYKMKPQEDILREIIELINNGAKVIGFNNHYRHIDKKGLRFFEMLFKAIKKSDNAQWIMPLK